MEGGFSSLVMLVEIPFCTKMAGFLAFLSARSAGSWRRNREKFPILEKYSYDDDRRMVATIKNHTLLYGLKRTDIFINIVEIA